MGGDYRLRIRRPGKSDRVFDLDPGLFPIGSDANNRIVLPGEGVAWRHAVLSVLDEGVFIDDLASDGSVTVVGAPVTGRAPVPMGEAVGLGPYLLFVEDADHHAPSSEVPETGVRAEEPVRESELPVDVQPDAPSEDRVSAVPLDADARAEETRRRSVRRQIQRELLKRLDLKRMAAGHVNEAELRRRAQDSIRQIIREVRDRLPGDIAPETIAKEVYDEALGLGPLEDLLEDTDITEIMVNGPDRVYVEREGKLFLTGKTFLDDDSVLAVIERIVSPIGRRIDESQPYVDARLPDGSRVNAIIHPLSLVGPCLTIRKFARDPFKVEDLIAFGTWTPDIVEFIQACVRMRRNIVISGGTGSGKTTLLNVISGFLPQDERILTIEDAAELRLNQPHVIRLEARPPNIEGRGAITVRDLVRNALRMRPDRIVVGECRGGEALDMLQAMNTGHEGSLTTVHANSPRDVISRLETMVLMAGMELPLRAIREQIGAAIHLVVHEARFSDGTRKVSRITEVVGLEGDQITMQDLFEYRQTGVDGHGRVTGVFQPTGSVPTFIEEMRVRGVDIRQDLFDPNRSPA